MASSATELPAFARDRAFETLYRRYVDDVYRYALAMLRNPADAEDVTQTTFLNAYRAVKRGEQIKKPKNWLITIAHNAARSRYARVSRRVDEVPLEDHLERLAVPEVERPQVQEVLEALGELPLNQRAAIVMRELEGRTYAEISETLGVSVSAVETLIFRARRSLRLKASAIRVLVVVPAPGWLWRLLHLGRLAGGGAAGGTGAAVGGGAAAGGGAATGAGTMVGSGFLLKAAAAVVAAVLASGIARDNPRPADAARSPLPSPGAGHHGGSAAPISAVRGDPRPSAKVVPAGADSTAVAGRLPDGDARGVSDNQPGRLPQPTATGALVLGG